MQLIPIKDLEYNTSNIPADTTIQWAATVSYTKATTRQLNNKLYKCYEQIEELSTYIFNSTDISKPDSTIRIIDDVVMDSTSVPCVEDVTIVYVVENNTYYRYNSASGNVDFTTEDITSPSHFTALDSGRYEINHPENTPLIWEDLGFTNKYKQLDKNLGSQTVVNGDMEFSFVVSKVDSIYFFNVLASQIDVKVTQIDTSEIVIDTQNSMRSKDGGSWYNFWFKDFFNKTKLFVEIPMRFNVLVEIKLHNIGGYSKCGLIGIGKKEFLGATLYGAGIGIVDFSKQETNADGESYFEQGRVKSTNNITLDVVSADTDRVIETLTKYRSTPVIFIGSKQFKSTYVFGIYTKFDTLISTPTITKLTLDLEGLI